MSPTCPKCREKTLVPITARPEAPGHVPPSRCTACHGIWLSHGPESLPAPTIDDASATPTDADGRPGFCPAGHGWLRRATIDAVPAYHLDHCSTCGGTWFDPGEWARFSSSEWLAHLDDLWDPAWQRRAREAKAREHQLAMLEKELGAEAFAKVLAAAEALRTHPRRSLALAFLLEEARSHRPAA